MLPEGSRALFLSFFLSFFLKSISPSRQKTATHQGTDTKCWLISVLKCPLSKICRQQDSNKIRCHGGKWLPIIYVLLLKHQARTNRTIMTPPSQPEKAIDTRVKWLEYGIIGEWERGRVCVCVCVCVCKWRRAVMEQVDCIIHLVLADGYMSGGWAAVMDER